MRKFIVTFMVLIQAASSYGQDCRKAVVQAYESLGVSIEEDSFSMAKFEDYGISVDEFNELSTEEQEAIYVQVRPLSVMVSATVKELSTRVAMYAGTFYEIYLMDKLELWRENIDSLNSCSI